VANDARTFNLDLAQDRVEVAIGCGLHHPQAIPRRLALGPELIAGATEESHVASLQGAFVRFAVHEAEHQDFTARGILHYGRRQPAHLVEVDFYSHAIVPFAQKQKPADFVSGLMRSGLLRSYPVISADTFAT
jgi:hypothetical protein